LSEVSPPLQTPFEKLGAEMLARMFEVAAHGLALLGADGRFLHINARGCAILGRPYEGLRATTLLECVSAATRKEAQRWFSSSLRGGAETRDLEVVHPHNGPGGRTRLVSCFCVPVTLEDEIAGLLALHDVTENRRAEREAHTLSRVASSLSAGASVYEVSSAITRWVVKTSGAVAAAVVLFQGDVSRGYVTGTYGLPRGFGAACRAGLAAGRPPLTAHVLLADEGARVVRGARAAHLADPAFAELTTPLQKAPWDTLVSVPLQLRAQTLGVLFAYFPEDYEPESELNFLGRLAGQCVLAIENARLLADAQDSAALEERQRLARELHDSVSQALYGIALGSKSALSQLYTHPERVEERLQYVLAMTEAAISEMRALIFELRPELLETEGLGGALAKLAAAARVRHHLEAQCHIGTEPPLPMNHKSALYRVAQEALHNVVKHARSRRVRLSLTTENGLVRLEVSDDGVGFDPQARFAGRLGLSSMRERVEALQGTLEITSAPGRGTRLLATLPLPE
jgi:PAS domain S-box-containing protein